MMDFDFNFKPSDYYDGDIQKEILESPNDLDEFVENGVTIAGIDFGDGPYNPTLAHLVARFFNGKYHYKLIEDDFENVYKLKHSESYEPLTLRQVIENIDTAILTNSDETDYEELPLGVMESQLMRRFSCNEEKEEILRSFEIYSKFYPLEEYSYMHLIV